jgi:hypothetical protein
MNIQLSSDRTIETTIRYSGKWIPSILIGGYNEKRLQETTMRVLQA